MNSINNKMSVGVNQSNRIITLQKKILSSENTFLLKNVFWDYYKWNVRLFGVYLDAFTHLNIFLEINPYKEENDLPKELVQDRN